MSLFTDRRPILMAIVGEGRARSAEQAIAGGADLIQVRAPELGGAALIRLVLDVIALVGAERVVVNSRPDLAERTGALGVHLKESGLDPRSVRRAFPGLLIGVSRHTREGLLLAAEQEVDYVVLGPVMKTPLKEDRVLPAADYPEWIRATSVPVIAVGGITPENAALILATGAAGLAAIRPFEDPSTAAEAARRFRGILDRKGLAGSTR